ncbi:hypothetical protein F4818DRAFT_77289 [Hypoxylon cercidicola]|nr:hypothetical protein F4818DRAFT_77289 [Hypoxylon cercidicola]
MTYSHYACICLEGVYIQQRLHTPTWRWVISHSKTHRQLPKEASSGYLAYPLHQSRSGEGGVSRRVPPPYHHRSFFFNLDAIPPKSACAITNLSTGYDNGAGAFDTRQLCRFTDAFSGVSAGEAEWCLRGAAVISAASHGPWPISRSRTAGLNGQKTLGQSQSFTAMVEHLFLLDVVNFSLNTISHRGLNPTLYHQLLFPSVFRAHGVASRPWQ